MAKIVIGGVEHNIPPFKFREIKAAAPYIDRVLAQRRAMAARVGETPDETAGRIIDENSRAVELMTDALADTIAVVAVGVLRGRGEFPYTVSAIGALVDEIEGELGMDEVNSLSVVFNDILSEAGMMKTRPTVPGEETVASPSATRSTESSQNSSQPDAPAATVPHNPPPTPVDLSARRAAIANPGAQ